MIGNRKEEGRVCIILLHVVLGNAHNPELKKPKSVAGFKPRQLRQNAIALLLALSPQPFTEHIGLGAIH